MLTLHAGVTSAIVGSKSKGSYKCSVQKRTTHMLCMPGIDPVGVKAFSPAMSVTFDGTVITPCLSAHLKYRM
jgi:hypothetical protein